MKETLACGPKALRCVPAAPPAGRCPALASTGRAPLSHSSASPLGRPVRSPAFCSHSPRSPVPPSVSPCRPHCALPPSRRLPPTPSELAGGGLLPHRWRPALPSSQGPPGSLWRPVRPPSHLASLGSLSTQPSRALLCPSVFVPPPSTLGKFLKRGE